VSPAIKLSWSHDVQGFPELVDRSMRPSSGNAAATAFKNEDAAALIWHLFESRGA
jgi:hypothetical protein